MILWRILPETECPFFIRRFLFKPFFNCKFSQILFIKTFIWTCGWFNLDLVKLGSQYLQIYPR
jgi:hypothetical protein